MTEDDARAWIVGRFGDEAEKRISTFVDHVVSENASQNLISPASVASIWSRHVVDSAQLLLLVPDDWVSWLDVGTGGGFPGMIIALLSPDRTVAMVEPRGKRAGFLKDCIKQAALAHAQVVASKVEAVTLVSDVISARAVGAIGKILRAASHCATAETTWLLPRGRSGAQDVDDTGSLVFHVEHSLTDPGSVILVGSGKPR
jgi:16S rRNA (guanine527-N7)-methyltransferase